MPKLNKEQQVQRDLAGIELRIRDIAQGSVGQSTIEEDDCSPSLCWAMGTEEWLRWIGAVRATFKESGTNGAPAQSVAFEILNLHHFDDFEGAADFLFRMGARP